MRRTLFHYGQSLSGWHTLTSLHYISDICWSIAHNGQSRQLDRLDEMVALAQFMDQLQWLFQKNQIDIRIRLLLR
jgi:uncharacterized protein CbrC (UPF0167 family)